MGHSNLFKVDGMVIVITGGGTGIGLSMTKALVDHGAAQVYILGRRKEVLDKAAQYSPDKIYPLVCDVSSKESLINAAKQVEDRSGFVNMVICNSGKGEVRIGATTDKVTLREYAQKALQQNVEDWSSIFATNTGSIFFTAMAFLTLLDAGNKNGNISGRSSHILITTSVAGYFRLLQSVGSYAASKAAATHLTKHLAGALAPYTIRVNALAPGLFESDLAAPIIAAQVGDIRNPKQEGSVPWQNIPATRIGRDTDIAGTIVYLASNAAAFQNGNITVLDGGKLAMVPSTY